MSQGRASPLATTRLAGRPQYSHAACRPADPGPLPRRRARRTIQPARLPLPDFLDGGIQPRPAINTRRELRHNNTSVLALRLNDLTAEAVSHQLGREGWPITRVGGARIIYGREQVLGSYRRGLGRPAAREMGEGHDRDSVADDLGVTADPAAQDQRSGARQQFWKSIAHNRDRKISTGLSLAWSRGFRVTLRPVSPMQ